MSCYSITELILVFRIICFSIQMYNWCARICCWLFRGCWCIRVHRISLLVQQSVNGSGSNQITKTS